MASKYIDTFTQSATIISAYNLEALKSFTPQLRFDTVAQMVSPTPRLTSNGNEAKFTIYNALSSTTGALSITGTSMAPSVATTKSQVTVASEAYGTHLAIETLKLNAQGLFNEVMVAADLLGDQGGLSIDQLARNDAYDDETGAAYCENASGYIFGGSTAVDIKSDDVRRAFTKLDSSNVPKPDGQYYIAIVHPNIIATLRAETIAAGGTWRAPKEYLNEGQLKLAGEVGEWEGFRFVSTTNVYTSGSGSTTQYYSYFLGKQAIGRWIQSPYRVVVQRGWNAHDNLLTVAWDIVGGWKNIRANALYKINSTAKYD